MKKEKNKKFKKEKFFKQVDTLLEDIEKLLKQVPQSEIHLRSHAASMIVYESTLWGTSNHYEALGLLEETKIEYREASRDVHMQEAMEEHMKNNLEEDFIKNYNGPMAEA